MERNLRVRPSSLRKKKDLQLILSDRVPVKLFNLGMRPKSEMEISRDAKIIPLAKLIGLGNVTVERSRNLIQRSEANQTLHHLDVPTALIIQGYKSFQFG